MKGKLFGLVRGGVGGFCISITFLLTAVLAVHGTVSAAVEEIATGLNDPRGFRLDGSDVYFTTDNQSSNCTLKKVAKSGGTVTTLISGVALYDSGGYSGIWGSFAVDSSSIYGGYGGYVNYNIFKAPKGGGSVTNLTSISGGGFSGVSGNYLYYSSGFSSINRMSNDGSGSTTLLSGYWVRAVVIDSTGIYFVNYWDKDVKKFDLNTSSLSTLISGNSGEGWVVIDSNNVYFMLSGTMKKISKSGGSVTTLISGSSNLGSVVSDDTYLYFVQDNAIKKIPVSGGTISTVTTDYTSSVSGMAVDDTYLYWGDASGGTGAGKIVRMPKSPVTVTPPTVTISSATNVTSNSATLNGTVNANGQSTTAWFNYGITSGSYTGTSTTQSVSGSSNTSVSADISGLTASTTYYYRIAAQNSAGTAYGSETSFTTTAPPDTTAPSGSVTINSGSSYTNSTAVTLNLSATDGVGVTGYYLSDTSSTPTASASGWSSVTSTTSYTANVSYTVSSGDGNKTVYIWYKDLAGNVSGAANGSITLDTTSPTVTITSPTSTGVYTSPVGSLDLSGSASDSSSGISAVIWNNTFTGGNGTATGTTSWTISGIGLSMGENTINVTARDGANNTGTGTIKVTYSGNAPTVTTSAATNVTSNSATLNGTVNANGLSTSAWFQYGLTSGAYTGTSTTQTVSGSSTTSVNIAVSGLTAGKTYYYRMAASSSAGTSYGSELSFSTPDSSAPTGSFTINTGAAYTGTTTVTLNLSATDDVMVGGYYISLNSTTPSSSAAGWVAVSATTTYTGNISYTLSSGDGNKTVYVWYKDFTGNVSGASNASISLDTTAPTVTITSPTPDATYTATSSTVSLGGSASDITSGIKTVTWSNNKGGSGTASGTTSWTISTINLSLGDNVITVTATDGSGNSGTDTITVTYNVTTTPTPTAVPTATTTPKPTPTAQPTPTRPPTLPPLPTPLVSPSPAQEGVVFGFVNDEDEQALEGVTVTIVGANGRSPLQNSTETDENGYYEFRGLDAGEYALTYEKEGYKTQTMDISLEEGELKDVETVILEQVERGKIYGYAVNIKGNPIEFVRLKLRGIKTKVTKSASTDADGFFEFTDLDADTYVIVAKKKGYRKNQQKVKLGDGESEEIEIVMKKTSKRIKKLLLEEDIQ